MEEKVLRLDVRRNRGCLLHIVLHIAYYAAYCILFSTQLIITCCLLLILHIFRNCVAYMVRLKHRYIIGQVLCDGPHASVSFGAPELQNALRVIFFKMVIYRFS